jgi:hypothetical protein
MFKSILVPIDLSDTELAKPAIATAATLSQTWSGTVRLLNVLPMTPVMLAEYVPADFDAQQRQASEEALAIVARESGIDAQRISSVVRQGGIYHEVLEEAAAIHADLISAPTLAMWCATPNARCWWSGTSDTGFEIAGVTGVDADASRMRDGVKIENLVAPQI